VGEWIYTTWENFSIQNQTALIGSWDPQYKRSAFSTKEVEDPAHRVAAFQQRSSETTIEAELTICSEGS
jgi:hypothetical protein